MLDAGVSEENSEGSRGGRAVGNTQPEHLLWFQASQDPTAGRFLWVPENRVPSILPRNM